MILVSCYPSERVELLEDLRSAGAPPVNNALPSRAVQALNSIIPICIAAHCQPAGQQTPRRRHVTLEQLRLAPAQTDGTGLSDA